MSNRIISWFSHGAASAVSTKLAIAEGEPVIVANCWIAEEHPDNRRFHRDSEKWFAQPILSLINGMFGGSIYEVFKRDRFLVGPKGARCTGRLKKDVRKSFQRPGDRIIMGYCADEQDRIDRFIDSNPDVDVWPILAEKGLTHADCLAMVERAGLELPAMYQMGYRNNNCIGCVKGGMGYWNKIRRDFPDTFERMAAMERYLGRTILSRRRGDQRERIPLTELKEGEGRYEDEPDIECGIACEWAEREYAA
ncbi:MAG: hypothetical protein V3T82_08025 [Nitrospinaceae bacterium]